MQIELLLRQYLYQYKTIAFPGIGSITRTSDMPLPATLEKGEVFSLQDLQFTFNLQEKIDEGFITFVADKTGKIKSLAFADIESYFILQKQFINIGKTFTIEGIGSIHKQDDGLYVFSPGHFISASDEPSMAMHTPLKIREPQPLFTTKTGTTNRRLSINKKTLAIAMLLIGLALIVWIVYRMFFSSVASNNYQPIIDTAVKMTLPVDTNNVSSSVNKRKGFKAIIDHRYTRKGAVENVQRLHTLGYEAQWDSIGPTNFRIYIPVKDTAISRDSMHLPSTAGKYGKKIQFEPL